MDSFKNTLFFLCIVFFLFILNLPLFQAGVWCDAEMGILGLYSITALIACGILINFIIYTINNRKIKIRIQKTSLFLCALGSITLILMPFHKNVRGDLFGCPQLGDGLLIIVCLGVIAFTLENTSLFRIKKWIIPSATLGALSCGLLMSLNHPSMYGFAPNWVCYGYRAYLALFSVALMPAAYLYHSKWIRGSLVCISSFLILISYNKTAFCLIPICVFIMVLPNRFLQKNRVLLSISLCLIPIGLGILTYLIPHESLIERKHFITLIINYFTHHPISILSGIGLGQFGNATVQEIRMLPIQFFENGIPYQTWCGTSFNFSFHAMHHVADMTLSLGILGFIGSILAPYWLIKTVRSAFLKPSSIALILFQGISSTWFIDAICWPFIILGCVIIGKFQTYPRSIHIKNGGAIGGISIITSFLLWGAYTHGMCIFSYYPPLHSIWHKMIPPSFHLKIGDHETTGLHLAHFMNDCINQINLATPHIIQYGIDLFEKSDHLPFNIPLYLRMNQINLLNELLKSPAEFLPNSKNLNDRRLQIALFFITEAPFRPDLMIQILLSEPPIFALKFAKSHLIHSSPITHWILCILYHRLLDSKRARLHLQCANQLEIHKWIPYDWMYHTPPV